MFDRDQVPVIEVRSLNVGSRGHVILNDVHLDIPEHRVTAIIGPSGAGKSTLLKCLNRLIDLSPGLVVSGTIRFRGEDVRQHSVDVDALRQRIGIVFQQPVIFPGSIAGNVLFAARRLGLAGRHNQSDVVERALSEAGLWPEVRDRLQRDARTLSVGQQQRLAIARTLAGDPEVVLMDEPTSALDPRSTEAIESTIESLKASKSVVLVTHQLVQARRLADWVACICPVDGRGELMEAGFCEEVFCCPSNEETRRYLGDAIGCQA